MKTKILIVDDELDIQSSLSFALKDEGFEVLTASSPREAIKILGQTQSKIHVGLFDVWFPEGDGMELLQEARIIAPSSSIVMMSGHGNIELALKAIRLGAFDFLEKPLELEKVLVVLNNAAEVSRLKNQNADLQQRLLSDFAISPTFSALAEKIEKSFRKAKSQTLLLGEVGVGKHSLSRWMHSRLGESASFVSVPAALLSDDQWLKTFQGGPGSPGVLSEAAAGVLYFGNVEELPGAVQKFLVSLSNGQSTNIASGTRLVLSSNLSQSEWKSSTTVSEEFKAAFASSLFEVPALRDLKPELPTMVDALLGQIARTYSISQPVVSKAFLDALATYSWPGNGRELRNVLERIVLFRDVDRLQTQLDVRDLPEDFITQSNTTSNSTTSAAAEGSDGTLRDLRVEFERALLSKRLHSFAGNITRAAESLGIERSHLHRKLRQYGLSE